MTDLSATLLQCTEAGAVATKRIERDPDGTFRIVPFSAGTYFKARDLQFSDVRDLAGFLEGLAKLPNTFLIRGAVAPDADRKRLRRIVNARNGTRPAIVPAARRWVLFDFDLEGALAEGLDPVARPDEALDRAVAELPEEFFGASFAWSFTSSTGFKPGKVGMRLGFVLTRPATDDALRAYFRRAAVPGLDTAVFHPIQPTYTADPVLGDGVEDPLPRRRGFHEGLRDEVELEVPAVEVRDRGEAPAGHDGEVYAGPAAALRIRGRALELLAGKPFASPGDRHRVMRDAAVFGRRAGLDHAGLVDLAREVGKVTGKPDADEEADDAVRWAWSNVPQDSAADRRRWDRLPDEKHQVAPAVAPAVPLLVDLADAVALNLPRSPVPLGIPPLDHVLGGGIAPDESLVVGAAPGSFKTSLVAFAVPSLATEETAVLFVAADEPANRVARKVACRFNEAWSTLTAEYPPVLARLRAKVAERDAFIRITHPRATFSLEDALDAFDREAPRDRRRIVLLDHLHAVESRDARPDDTEKSGIERVVGVLIDGYVRSKGWSLVALSEVTKAAVFAPATLENPMGAFAGSRKIASRFDVALVMVLDGPRRVRILPAKNRFGSRVPFSLEWDVERWVPTHVPDASLEAEATAAKQEKQAKAEAEEDAAVLDAVRRAAAKGEALKKGDLPDRVKLRAARVRGALARLVEEGVLRLEDGPPGSSGGARPVLVVEVKR